MKLLRHFAVWLLAGVALASAQANKWEKTMEFSGYGTTQTTLMPMLGEKWRIKYQAKTRCSVSINMLAPDGQILSNVFNSISLQGPYTESWNVTPGMEQVAFRVEGDVNGWTVTVEQFVDEIASWKLFKWRRDAAAETQKRLARYGMWTGEASEEIQQKVTIQARRWRITAKSYQTGRLKYEVLNADGHRIISNHRLAEGESASWVYAQGEFTILCSSIGTKWDLAIDVDETASGN